MQFRNFLLAGLRPDDLAVLAPRLKEVSLSKGQVLFEPDEPVETLYFPSSACASVVAVMEDGKTYEIASVGRESAAGLLDAMTGARATTRTFAQIAGNAMALPANVFRNRLMVSPELLRLALLHVRAAARQAETGVACNLAHAAESRLARWLLMTQDRTGSDDFPLTQDYMAVMTGVQRSTVSAMASALKRAKVIDYARGALTILDRPALIGHACECYANVEDAFDALRTGAGA